MRSRLFRLLLLVGLCASDALAGHPDQKSANPPANKFAAQTQSVLIEDLTWPEVRDVIAAGKTTAIYYAGSTEQNGPHMALGKHNFLAHYVAQRIAERLGNALVYPTMPFAPTGDPDKKTGHMQFPGSVTLSEETFGAVAREVARSAIAAGFKTVLLMGDHGGGQETLKNIAEEMDRVWASKGARVFYIGDLYTKAEKEIQDYLTQHHLPIGQHADIDDTSQLMAIDSDGKWIRRDKLAPDDGKMGVRGDPRQSSAELGKVFVQSKIDAAVAQIQALLSASEKPPVEVPPTRSAEDAVRAAMDERRKASLEGDTESITRSMTDDYVQTDISGYVQNKANWLNEYFNPIAELIKAGKFHWEVYEQKNVQVNMHGDSAVVIGTLELKGTGLRPAPQHTVVADPNHTFSLTLRFTHVYIKRNGKWLLAALHNQLPLPPPPTASPAGRLDSNPNLQEEIAKVDDERRNAYLQNDAASLDPVLADDVTIITGIGTEEDKHFTLADVGSHDLVYKTFSYDQRKVRVYGDTAVVTSHAEITAKYKDRDLSGKLLVTRVYAKQQGSWRLVAMQSTRLPQ